MGSIARKWEGLALQARLGLGAGAIVIVAMMALLGYWAYRTDYQVLFADLAPRDAAAMTAELDKMKITYQLDDGGNTILVPKALVYKTRLQLMGTNVPLHGAVGFEVFNNADFGMTEFVQKVNYLRAIQGELTRTILSIDDIQSARVHLAIPEQGLFKKAATRPKASVTLAMKPGRALSAAQVAGIQRLVAASVPDIASADVTLVDQHGMALTRADGADNPGEGASAQLDAKRSTEDYLVRKVTQVLDRAFGPGEAIASVDVALNLDQSKVTTEEVLPAKGGAGADGNPAGVVVRERYTLRDGEPVAADLAKPGAAATTTGESDFQVGRRVEQLAVASGTVRRMTVAVLVRQALSEQQLDKLREVVSLAVGLNSARGDAIVVNSLDMLSGVRADAQPVADAGVPAAVVARAQSAAAPAVPDPGSVRVVGWVVAGVLASIAALAALAWRRTRRRVQPSRLVLSEAARQQMLASVRQWIEAPVETTAATGVRK